MLPVSYYWEGTRVMSTHWKRKASGKPCFEMFTSAMVVAMKITDNSKELSLVGQILCFLANFSWFWKSNDFCTSSMKL